MTKQSGLGDNFYVDGFDISGDVTSLDNIASPRAVLEVTGIDKSAMERLHGLKDGVIEGTCWFNDAASGSHTVLKNPPATNSILSYFRGTAIGNPAASLVTKRTSYDMTRGDDGSLTFSFQGQGNNFGGLEWGYQLTAGKRTDGSATNGSAFDQASASPGAFGGQLWVHLFAFTGTSVTIKVQESSDNAGDAYADVTGATTGALSAVGAIRVATGAINVERYVRLVTTGTFSNAVFAAQWLRNDELPAL